MGVGRLIITLGAYVMAASSTTAQMTSTKEEQSTGKVGGREEMIVEQLKLMVEEGRSLSQGKYGSNVCATGIAKFDANTTARQQKEAVLRAVTNGWTQERRVKDAPRVVLAPNA